MALVRNVTGRKRIDLCGELVDTYTVEMTGTLRQPDHAAPARLDPADVHLRTAWSMSPSTAEPDLGDRWVRVDPHAARTTMPKDAS